MKQSSEANASLLEAFRTILSFHFGDVAIETIKRLSPNPLERFSTEDIAFVCRELSLQFSEDRRTIDTIEPFMLPCIALAQNGEAVVVSEIDDTFVTIQRGVLAKQERLKKSELKKGFDRFLFITREAIDPETLRVENGDDKSWFFGPIKRMWPAYLQIAILTLFINLFALALPLFTMSVYNRVIPAFATDTLFVLAVGTGAILIFDVVLKSARLQILERVVRKLSNHFEEELFKRVLTLQSAYDRYNVGTKLNLFKELHVVKDFFATKTVHILDIPYFLIAMTVIFVIDPMMTIVPLVAASFVLAFNFLMQYPLAGWFRKSFEEGQTKQGFLVDHLHGHETLRLANALPSRLYLWRKMSNFYHHIQGKIQFLSGISVAVSSALVQGVSLLTVVVGVYRIHEGALNVGALIAVTILAGRAMVPVINLSNVLIRYKQVREALASLSRYWHLPTENEKYHEPGIGRVRGEILFDHVTFTYPGARTPSVSDMTFTIKPGEKVGIIGATGAGKSTIQKLLCGLLSPQKGRIYLDGSDIETIHPVELRHNIAMMPQEPYLFDATLKENLELGGRISKRRMLEVLKQTGLDSLLQNGSVAETFKTGERGANLSVGQRHLVSLARVLLSDAPVVVLDEPTTGLDTGLERRLVERLSKTLRDKTLIVVTHRFAALDLVDRLIVVDKGRIVLDGPKVEVLHQISATKAVS